MFLLLSIFAASVLCDPVKTTSGVLRGFSPYPGVDAYLGIPYAQPPTGDLRFAPPKPFNGTGLRDCYDLSPGCFQLQVVTAFSVGPGGGVSESEDMLTINVWKPRSNTSLPVMIFLYGGGFTGGANAVPEYNGAQLAKEQDIIVATINYRVNIFGFPNTPALPKNPGLLDQRLGVEWLRDNIGAFGGDPTRMTLAGHSAGSQSIAFWAHAYPHDPIVNGFIELSGQPGLIPPDDGSSWRAIANATGCSNSNSAVELQCMRRVPPRTLLRAMSTNNQPALGDMVISPVPVVDNVTVFPTLEYANRGKAGSFAKIPLLVSNTLNEADGVLPFFPLNGVNATLSDQITLAAFHCPVAAAASYWAAQDVPVWRYLFRGSFVELLPYSWMRPFHGSDLELVFAQERASAYQDLGTEVQKAARYIRDAVGAFVRDPRHGLEGLGWKTYNPNAATLVSLFGTNTSEVSFSLPSVYDEPCRSM